MMLKYSIIKLLNYTKITLQTNKFKQDGRLRVNLLHSVSLLVL